MRIVVRVDDHGVLERWRQAPEAIERDLRNTLDVMGAVAEREVARRTPVGATAMLSHSITHEARGSGTAVLCRVFSEDLPVKVASVEFGRRPGRMPPWGPGSALELWVRRKRGGGLQAAFLIARAIGRRGTRPRRMFRRGARAARPMIRAQWEQFVRRAKERL